jgi:chemotaxis protein methyltransferase CheR
MTTKTVTPTTTPSSLDQVSDAQLARYADLIYSRTGVRVSPQKKALLSNRLRRRLRSTGIASFEDYYVHLKRLPQRDPEWDAFLQEITTHETYLFRDQTQWDWFRNSFLPECALARRGGAQPRLRIWSAACSTGDEAFTAACCIVASLQDFAAWKIHIVGTDIGRGAVDQAKTGVFGDRAMRLVPDAYKRCYFTKAKDADIWQAKPVLMEMVAFHTHNLLDPMREALFDLVFLKNVMIYFDRASKKQAVANVQAMVRPGGQLVVGPAEGVGDFLHDFEREKSWLLRKPHH